MRNEREREKRKRTSMGTRSAGAGEVRPGAQAQWVLSSLAPSGRPHALFSVLTTPHAAQKPPLRAPRLADAIARRAGAACLTLLLRRMALPVSALLW